jgi:Lon protease-like protein
MGNAGFDTPFDSLPNTLPVFPLAGVLMLPGTQLPLNIFEPRYLNMVIDALGAGRLIGMIQPAPSASEQDESPPLCPVGCAGRVTSFSETDDGRFLIVLSGLCRFSAGKELATTRGYRRVLAEWSGFESDYRPSLEAFARAPFMRLLRGYFRIRKFSVDWQALKQLEPWRLVNVLATSLPFATADRQALLEAGSVADRAQLLTALLELALVDQGNVTEIRH